MERKDKKERETSGIKTQKKWKLIIINKKNAGFFFFTFGSLLMNWTDTMTNATT